ncbi:MAG: hypothetical protein J6Y99_10825 [Bacteroidales bacterium]|nr:hypothetical protein [Bacteroidales bacterium]
MKQLLFLLCAATGTCAWAHVLTQQEDCLRQNELQSQVLMLPSNGWRHGDRLIRVQVEYVQPGDLGQGCVWKLGEITKKSKEFPESVASNGDTIAVFLPDRIVHYVVHGDTLWDKGEQQRRTYRICQEERPVLRYPFQYGDSLGGTFLAKGVDEGIDLTVSGFGYTTADGTGILVDGADTLHHILRLHLMDDYTEDYGGQAQLHYRRDKYQWYMTGWRYPVQESVHWSMEEGDTAFTALDSVTYLYLPDMQLELAEDLVNDSIRQQIALWDAQNGTQGGIKALSEIKTTLSPDGRSLTIDYTVTEGVSDLTFIASDVIGNVLGSKRIDNVEAGDHQEVLTLSRKATGDAVLLRVECDGEIMEVKMFE